MAAPHIEDLLLTSLTQAGLPYVFGVENDGVLKPKAQDCSELVQWSAERCGLKAPDGAYYQWQWTKAAGLAIPVDQAIATRGALLYHGTGRGTGRAAIDHTAWSLGDGTTIEARGTAWGVGSFKAAGRFQYAGLMPGVDYSQGHGQLPQPEPPTTKGRDTVDIYPAPKELGGGVRAVRIGPLGLVQHADGLNRTTLTIDSWDDVQGGRGIAVSGTFNDDGSEILLLETSPGAWSTNVWTQATGWQGWVGTK